MSIVAILHIPFEAGAKSKTMNFDGEKENEYGEYITRCTQNPYTYKYRKLPVTTLDIVNDGYNFNCYFLLP